MPARRRRLHPAAARHLVALGLYSVAALLLTWPLAARLTTHVPGDGIDDPALAWNLWLLKTQIVDHLNWDIFHIGWMFHPVGINLAFYTLTPLNGLQSIPLQTGLQLVVANNLILLSTFVLGAYGAFLLGLYLQRREETTLTTGIWTAPFALALIAGLIYGFGSAKLFYAALGQFNIAGSHWIPFAALYVLRLGDSDSPRRAAANGLMAGLFIVFQAWAELTYASFLLIFCAIYLVWRLPSLWAGPGPAATTLRSLALGFAVAALVFSLGITPFLAAMLPDMLREGDFFASGGGFADVFSADLMGYLAPTRLHPLLGDWAAQLPFPNDKGQHIYLGYSLFALILVAAIYRRKLSPPARRLAGFWLLSALVFWALTLGPHVRWAGSDLPIPGPFALVSRLPFFSGNRYPSRYSVMLLVSAASLSVYGLRLALNAIAAPRPRDARRGKRLTVAVCVGLAAIFLFEHLSAPLPLSDLRTPPIYSRIAAEAGDFAILELPTGWRNGARVLGKSDVLIMLQQWHQTVHGKRRLGGNTSRNPEHKFQYFTEAPLIGDLIALMNADREHIAAAIGSNEPDFAAIVERNRRLAAQTLAFLGVKYVVVHVDKSPDLLLRFVEEALPVALIDEWQGAAQSAPGQSPPHIRLYRVREDGASAVWENEWEFDAATSEGKLHLAAGWSALDPGDLGIRYATRPVSELLLAIPESGGILNLEIDGSAGAPDVALNGQRLTAVTLPEGGDFDAKIAIPPGAAHAVVDRLTLTWRGEPQPIAALSSPEDPRNRPIGASGVHLAPGHSLAVRSAGEEVGDFAHIYVDGKNVAPNMRGYNLAALTPDGELLASAAFDTHAAPEASQEMAAWLQQWPAGTILAGAVADEASHSLQPEAVAALQRFGVQTDLRGRFRWSHAFIGAAGVAPGDALEQATLITPAEAVIGAPVDAAQIYGGIGRVHFYPSD
ncbi:MAG: interleukin-like EMT inducer domain-containing protein [Chloroflexota bacterium]|nr:interleukin-like EMT inducer domain-containing protein [Chloroflexota bacterium]